VSNADEEQALRRSGKTRVAWLTGIQLLNHILDLHFTCRAPYEGADDQSNHLVKKAVAIEIDRDTRTKATDTHGINCSNRAPLGFAPISSKSGKIMGADASFGGFS